MNFTSRGVNKKKNEIKAIGPKMFRKIAIFATELFIMGLLALVIWGASGGIGIFKGIIATAPDIGNIDVTPSGYSTFVYDVEGNQTAKLVSTDSNRIPVSMDQVPEDLTHAFVAIEDERFYEHNGIDVKGIIRAAVVAVTQRDFSQGASTITQQLLKNNVFTDWTSESSLIDKFKRKFQEQYLALELEKVMSKDDILINYMNTINLGQNTLGVQAASLRYFGKDVSTLTLSESAVIAGITQNPSRYNPISHPDKNAERREKVLRKMVEQGYISQDEYDTALADDVYSRIQLIDSETADETVNSYFVDALTDDVLADLIAAGYTETQAYTLLYSGGLKIYSTQDPKIQSICDDVFSNPEYFPANTKWYLNYQMTVQQPDGNFYNTSTEMFRTYFRQFDNSYNLIYSSQEDAYADIAAYQEATLAEGEEVFDEKISLTPQPQVSITVEDQTTGQVVAMVGGRGQKSASRTLNRATDTTRQPGSTFKIVSTYAPALDSAGLTLANVQNDAPFNYSDGRPVRNWYGEEYRGLTTLREGIRESMNIIAVKTLTQITPQLGFDYLQNFGFTTLVESREVNTSDGVKIYSDITQSLALGGITDGVTNEELNAAYATIANGGLYIKPKLYTKVVDHDGNVILDNTELNAHRVIKETTAFLLTDAMEDVVTSGTGGSVNFGGTAIAGKTGTTSDYNDVWFAGYTTYYTATTWAGYDNNVKLSSSDEKNLAKKLWRQVMSRIHEDLEGTSFAVPSGIITASVCSRSGKLPVAGLCDAAVHTEYFAEGTVPTETCDVHYEGEICAYDNCPAAEGCPFSYHGITERLPQEHPSLLSGSSTTTTTVDENGNEVSITQGTQAVCQHTAEFFANPDYEAIIAAQRVELEQRIAAAAAAAAAEAAANGTADPAAQPAAEAPAAEAPAAEAPAAEAPAAEAPAAEAPAQ
ncbi:MAG: transglycosylase domain-containing protein [Lachnospiraceae bacterium]|nr:transglycosylase domain-containing protein [Lachnospiraceae bacterium]